MKDLQEAVRAADPRNLQMLADIAESVEKASREIGKIDQTVKKIKTITDSVNDAARASQAASEEAQRLSRASNALAMLSFAVGTVSRYDALTSQGYDPTKAVLMSVGQSATYNALTCIPVVGVADLTLTAAQMGVEWAAPDARVLGVKPTDLSLSNTVDIGFTVIDYASTAIGNENDKAQVRAYLNSLSMDRIRQSMDRIREMIARASPEEAAKLTRLREMMNQVLTEKEQDP
jgi:hypothetical protein